jgi:hypothetical protein
VYVDEVYASMVGYEIVPAGPLFRLVPLSNPELDQQLSQLIPSIQDEPDGQ